MSRRTTPARDPRQRAGLTLATPRRVRAEVDATPWELLPAVDRRRACRPIEALTLAWSAQLDEAQVAQTYWSSPVERAHGAALVAALDALGLRPPAVRLLDALCWAHVARVRYPDGRSVAYGLAEPPRGVAHVEATGYPFARVEGRRVRPWEGRCHGHLDGEVLGAPEYVRPRTVVPAEGASS